MGAYARHRSLLSLTLLAFLVSILLPFAAVYNPSAAQASESSLFGDRILICTIDGFKWVSLDDVGTEQEDHGDSNQKEFECALCYVSAHATKDFLASVHDVFGYTPSKQQTLRFDIAGYMVEDRSGAYFYQSRAPPVSA